jgi:hypothetical protein
MTNDTTYPLGARWPEGMDVSDATRDRIGPDRFPVIGEVESVPAGNAILRIGRTVSRTDHSWIQELHLVLTPAERDRLIADLIAQRPQPAIDFPDKPEDTQLAWAWDGDIARGNIEAFAEFLSGAQLAGEDYPKVVYAAAVDGTLTPVPFHIKTSPYDSRDYATATVAVTLADDVTVVGSWSIDGRT